MRLSAISLAIAALRAQSGGSPAPPYNPLVVFGADLVTWYGNSVDELWAEHRKAWEDSPELVTNGGFETSDGWTLAEGITVVDGVLAFNTSTTRAANTPSAQPLVAGRAYRVSLDVSSTSGSIEVFVGNTVSGAANSTGRHAFTIVTTAANQNIQVRSLGAGVFTIDNLSVKEIDLSKLRMYQDSAGTTPVTAVEQFVGRIIDLSGNGYHLSQSTATARPRLTRRVNLLPNSIFAGGGAAPTGWSRPTATGSSAPVSTLPDGSIVYRQSGVIGNRPYLQEAVARNVTAGQVERARVLVLSADGAGVTVQQMMARAGTATSTEQRYRNGAPASGTDVVATGDILEFVWTFTGAGTHSVRIGPGSGGNMATDFSVDFAQPDARLADYPSSWPQYQRVTSASDYDEVGFPARLVPDGADDFYLTNNIDLTSTNKLVVLTSAFSQQVSAGGCLWALSNTPWATEGAARSYVNTNGTGGYVAGALMASVRGTSERGTDAAGVTTPFVTASVIDGSLSSGEVTLRVNGVPTPGAAPDSGLTAFGNLPLYVGGQSAGNRFLGDIFALPMIVKRLMTPDELAAAEKAFGKSIGVLQ